ncbi:hypothetical protein MNBD_ALPHA09-858 [hydrothermal vent metagenome]|uniref:Uncharacterized protein n=1 Tax=hydrothermal vent metagenome TaxID=652676 RepID=A0A3B0TFN3_9ZZZZ
MFLVVFVAMASVVMFPGIAPAGEIEAGSTPSLFAAVAASACAPAVEVCEPGAAEPIEPCALGSVGPCVNLLKNLDVNSTPRSLADGDSWRLADTMFAVGHNERTKTPPPRV